MYLVRLFITGVVGESVTLSGPVHTVFTVTGTSTAGLNSTVQVRVTSDPTGRMGLTGLLVTFTEVGAETAWRQEEMEIENYHIQM